jgi:serine/threonine-protein kinase
VEKVCQAVAFAHSKGIIHRDLKPSNVMVGEFGEVQVMDWGLAKELSRTEPATTPAEATAAVETVGRVEEAAGLSRAGAALGTPAYMPPEQAAGDWSIVDERADVFALGAMLCVLLTGQPPYPGSSRTEVLRRARRGDLAEALGRLDQCGADAALVALCRECLAVECWPRPRHAGVVAERLAAYQAEVQERLRRAELERVAAQTRAQEEQARALVEQERTREALARVAAERRARQRLLALAAAVLFLLVIGVAAAWRMHQERIAAQARQDRADGEARAALTRAQERLEEGWHTHDLALLKEGKADAERAAYLARTAGEAVGQQVAAVRAEAQQRLDRAEKNQELLAALLDIVTPRETKTYTDRSGRVIAVAEPSVEQQYAAAFRRRWPEVDVDNQEESEVAARLRAEPEVVLQGVIAGLDGWMLERRQKGDEAKWRRLLGLVERLDPSEPRRQLRAVLIGANPQLRVQMNVAAEPVLTVLLLAQASREVGDMAGAEAVLRQALARRPDEVALLDALGKVLEQQGPSRLAEAIGCYRAARAKLPELGIALGLALRQAGQAAEGEAILRDLLRQQPKNPEMHNYLGDALHYQGRFTESLAAFRRGHELGSKQAGWRYPSLQRVRAAERMVELEKKLPAVLQGEASPPYTGGAIALAQMCQQYKKRNAAAARLYADAFAAEPKLAADLTQPHRYNAVCSAALAAAGQGEDARRLPDKVVTLFHRWALDWLRADLQAYALLVRQNNPTVTQAIQQRLAHWKRDPDLAAVRDPQALDRLSDNERAVWQALWRDVDELRSRVAKRDEAIRGRKPPDTLKTKPEGRSLPPSGATGR